MSKEKSGHSKNRFQDNCWTWWAKPKTVNVTEQNQEETSQQARAEWHEKKSLTKKCEDSQSLAKATCLWQERNFVRLWTFLWKPDISAGPLVACLPLVSPREQKQPYFWRKKSLRLWCVQWDESSLHSKVSFVQCKSINPCGRQFAEQFWKRFCTWNMLWNTEGTTLVVGNKCHHCPMAGGKAPPPCRFTFDGSNGWPLNGDPSASHAFRSMSCIFCNCIKTNQIWKWNFLSLVLLIAAAMLTRVKLPVAPPQRNRQILSVGPTSLSHPFQRFFFFFFFVWH